MTRDDAFRAGARRGLLTRTLGAEPTWTAHDFIADAVGALDDVDPYTARRLMDAHRQGYRQASGMEVAR